MSDAGCSALKAQEIRENPQLMKYSLLAEVFSASATHNLLVVIRMTFGYEELVITFVTENWNVYNLRFELV